MNNKIKNRIINALRAISRSWGPRAEVKKRAKVAPATFACSQCGVWIYEGKSTSAVSKICTDIGKHVIMGKIHMDHVLPVVPLEGWKDWDDFSSNIIRRMFCDESNWNALCEKCHEVKTSAESEIRKQHRSSKKKAKKKEVS